MDLSRAVWRRSRRSADTGNCVEVAAVWRKSSRSGGNGGDCVEVASVDRAIAVRDSKDPDGPRLAFPPDVWGAFLADAKAGRYDR